MPHENEKNTHFLFIVRRPLDGLGPALVGDQLVVVDTSLTDAEALKHARAYTRRAIGHEPEYNFLHFSD